MRGVLEATTNSFFLEGYDWSGKTGRGRFAIFAAASLVVILVSLVLRDQQSVAARSIGVLLLAAWIVPSIGYQVRRFHDTGRSGAWILLSYVPILGLLVVLFLLFEKSSEQAWKPVPRLLSSAGYLASFFLAAVLLMRIAWAPYWIPSGNMKPNLLIGDYISVGLVNFAPERGDVLVFRHPTNGTDYIKRLIGVPGDTVHMRGGVLHINGSPVPQSPSGVFVESFELQGPVGSAPICRETRVPFGGECTKEQFIESLPNGKQFLVLDAGPSALDNTGDQRVPDGMYFFLGDNRDNSTDSRVPAPVGIGLVPQENVIGRAERVLFSSAGRSLWHFWAWRGDRFLKVIE